MKWEKWIYLSAFLCGVVVTNIIGEYTKGVGDSLNRYHIAFFSFQGIVYEEYFLKIFFLRLSTVIALGIGSKLLPKKIVIYGFSIVMSVMLGCVATMMILANGIWGIWFWGCALVPHILFYIAAFSLWKKQSMEYIIGSSGKTGGLNIIVILVLIVCGCICEAYISPVIIENVIKY